MVSGTSTKIMTLGDFLDFFDFSYEEIDWETLSDAERKEFESKDADIFLRFFKEKTPAFRLLDAQGANLGNIQACLFEKSVEGLTAMIERMSIYVNDYVIESLENILDVEEISYESGTNIEGLKSILEENDLEYCADIVDCILDPECISFSG